ncbi:L domain containing protein [Babesia gibsoni]|uniref:L domain containing protein n=1 Tax=Babesia gibsoni TaxID=33632 RepID=A0AAD8LI98_BABGI|nr:L domain containing protein [Babesia gibsoni]
MVEDEGVSIQRIGFELDAPSSSTVLEYQCTRIKRIENLDHVKGLKAKKIENLDANTELESLDLYQNSIRKIENIDHLTNLRVLDLSFNEIDYIENLDTLTNLTELYLTSNRIAKVENVKTLSKLELLEVGSNKIRDYGEISFLKELNSLWMGRNKLTNMSLPLLPRLTKCSLQNNRIREWDEAIVDNCPQLQELYLSFNRLTEIPAFINKMKNLSILDLGNNKISKVHVDVANESIEEVWVREREYDFNKTQLNHNQIEDDSEVIALQSFKKLQVLYLEHNPIHTKLGPGYRNRILALLPRTFTTIIRIYRTELSQLDAIPVVNRVT